MTIHTTRRHFLKTTGLAGASLAAATPVIASAQTTPTIQEVIDKIIKNMTGTPLGNTVDVIKQGNPEQLVTGITLTFLGTLDILQHAVDRGHNFIISHEPVFYDHLDKTEWLQDHPVYQAKRDFIEEHNLVIWRCHDYIHRMKPDGIIEGMVDAFDWAQYQDDKNPILFNLPHTDVSHIIDHIKEKFNVPAVKLVGDPKMACSKVALMVGAPGGVSQMNVTRDLDPYVLICGEISEWMTNIYFQDAVTMGQRKALIVMGHQPSEEAGMAWMAEWLRGQFPKLNIEHQASGLGYTYA